MIVVVILAIISNFVGAAMSKLYVTTGDNGGLYYAILSYAFGATCWCVLARRAGNIAVTGVIWDVCATLIVIAVGMTLGERLTAIQAIGALLAIIGVGLLST